MAGEGNEKIPPAQMASGHGTPCDDDHEQQIDNSVTILKKIAGLYADRLLSDIVLSVGGRQFASHRLILCASSDVFQVMLMNPNWSESQETEIVLQEEDSCVQVFPEFLKYLYTGIIHINHFLVLPLVTLGDKYNVKDLIDQCLSYMCNHIVSAAKHNLLVSWLQYTLNCGHKIVYKACINFVKWNFEFVTQMDDFSQLESDVLVTFLQKSDLVVIDENSLFNGVAKWLSFQRPKLDDNEFKQLVSYVMSYIRFPMMSPSQLASLLINAYVIQYTDFFVDRLSFAMSFHHNKIGDYLQLSKKDKWEDGEDTDNDGIRCKRQRLNSCAETLDLAVFTPRLYTTEKWSSSLIIENYKNLPCYAGRTLVFTTPLGFAEWKQTSNPGNTSASVYEWAVDLFPKGVWFKQCHLIRWEGKLEIPEWVGKTVRLSVTAVKKKEIGKVAIGVLIYGKQDGVEYVKTVVETRFHFDERSSMVNLNDLMSFDDLNDVQQGNRLNANDRLPTGHSNNGIVGNKPYMIGNDNDTLKVQVIITPLNIGIK